MSDGYADNETEPQRIGTACHALAAHCIENNKSPFSKSLTEFEGVSLTPEMREATKEYVDYVNERSGLYPNRRIEQRITCGSDQPDFGGTSDCVLFGTHDLEVVDAKFGRIPVEVLDNEQLLCYAVLAAREYFPGRYPARIRMTVVQPNAWHRNGPIRSSTVDNVALAAFGARLSNAINTAESETKLTLLPGNHCKYCPALAECPAAQKQFLGVLECLT